MAPHSSTLAWKIPWTEEPGGLQSVGSLSQTRLSDFTFFSLSCTGEENGNPIQCSCLGNPMDSGAWQATGHGVSKRRTQLSSSRSFLTVSFYVLPPRGSCHPPDGLQMVERKKKTILGRISQTLEGCPLRQIYFHCSTSEHTNPPPLVILSCHGCSR